MFELIELKIAEAEKKIRNQEYGEAIAVLLEVIDENPKFALAYNDLGIIAWEQSRWYDAFGLFREAVNLENSRGDFANNLLDAALKLRKIEDTREIFAKAAADNPDNSEIAEIYKAISDPNNDIYMSVRALSIGYWHPLIEKGDNHIKNGEHIDALTAYIEHADTVGASAEAYNGLGIVQFSAKEYDEAFNLFFESLKINPINRDVFLNLFDSAKECGQEDAALQIYETLVKNYPLLEEIRSETEFLKKK